MNEFGEPNMGNPSVRFDEGRERVGHWPLASQSNRSRLLYDAESSYGNRDGCGAFASETLAPLLAAVNTCNPTATITASLRDFRN
jgi:hypothetical protein